MAPYSAYQRTVNLTKAHFKQIKESIQRIKTVGALNTQTPYPLM